jgi:hypothetical protein
MCFVIPSGVEESLILLFACLHLEHEQEHE